MGDFVAFGSALRTACDAASTVPVYYGLAPQGSACPYIIINRQAAVDGRTFTSEFVSADYQVKVISDRIYPYEAALLYDNLNAVLDGTALSISGYTTQRCERTRTIEYREPDGFWHVGGLYRIEARKN